MIREYKDTDKDRIIQLLSELQEFERVMESSRTRGKENAPKFFDYIYEQVQKKEGKIFVAEDLGNIIGFISFWIEREPDKYFSVLTDYIFISDIFIQPALRGKGFGKALFQKVKQYAEEKRVQAIKLHVLSKNQNALRAYKHVGLREYEKVLLYEL